jgi:hypothetical protein
VIRCETCQGRGRVLQQWAPAVLAEPPRGPCGARDEFHLAATIQNLRKLAKLIPRPQTIPPLRG